MFHTYVVRYKTTFNVLSKQVNWFTKPFLVPQRITQFGSLWVHTYSLEPCSQKVANQILRETLIGQTFAFTTGSFGYCSIHNDLYKLHRSVY